MTDVTQVEPETIAFGPLRISFDARVLRPRPWTAAQSAWAAELIAAAPTGPVLELCAGAGQIGLLAVAGSGRRLVCVDLDPVACGYARANAEAAGLGELVEVRQGSVDQVLDDGERFAVVVADPPWVRRSEVGRYPEDPLRAIDGGVDGLDLARTCLGVAQRQLRPGGSVVLQVGSVDQVGLLDTDRFEVVEVREYERGALVRLDLR